MAIIDQLNGPTPKGLSLEGQNGPRFESESQRTTSPIQARTDGAGHIDASKDMIDGKNIVYGQFIPPSALSLQGRRGRRFEIDGDINSPLQANTDGGGNIYDSDDLWNGRHIRYSQFMPDSNPPVSFPDQFVGGPYYPSLGGPYNQTGPSDGVY